MHREIRDLALLYRQEFGVTFPAINLPLVLFGHVRRLALPCKETGSTDDYSRMLIIRELVEVFPAVNRLSKLLGYTYDFPRSQNGRVKSNDFPEVRLVALLVVVTKLFYPFDDIKRYPVSLKDPQAQLIDWNEWVSLQRKFDDREKEGGKLGRGNEFNVKETDVFQMTPEQLDEYMDWYEKSWVDTKGTSTTSVSIINVNSYTLNRVKSISGYVSSFENRKGDNNHRNS